jgi:hypothetical protein
MPYAHPTIEHIAPLFAALGAAAIQGNRRVSSSTGTGWAWPTLD